MWYVGFKDDPNGYTGIGYAYSSNGTSWTKYDDTSTTTDPFANSDPVINIGPDGSWEDDGISSPTLIKEDSIYRMWYDGEQINGGTRIGY